MTLTKQQLREFVEGLPDEVDVEDVMYRLYLREKLEASEAAIREGRTLSQADVEQRVQQWFR
jgi:hypothetical protein